MDKKHTVYINLLGEFSLKCKDTVLTVDNLSGQLCNLVAFLVENRDKTMPQDAIINALWPEEINNPAAALKNLVYRFRKTSDELGFAYAKNFILSYAGTYKINPDISCQVDAHVFAQCCLDANACQDSLEKAQYLREAVDLYEGDFFQPSNYRSWVVGITQYYHAMYFNAVYSLLEIYRENEDYFGIESVAQKAVKIDCFEEEAHKYIMYCLSKQNKQAKATAHYNYISELFYSELGVELSAQTRQLFIEISKTLKTNSTDITSLKEELKENPDEVISAFYCELEIFKQLYRFEARSAMRFGSSIFIGLFTITAPDGEEAEKAVRERAMNHMHQTIRENLRKGDVFSRCSSNQYVLMLPMINFENGQMVLNRIEKRFKSTFHSRKIILTHSLQPLDPAGWM